MADSTGKITVFFENFIKKESLFTDKKIFHSAYLPETLHHREDQTQHIANILAPALKRQRPSNVFLYGKTGTGKTVTVKFTTAQLTTVAQQQNIPVSIVYVNCKLKRTADTEYRLVAELCRALGKEVPPTGLPTEEIYKIFRKAVDTKPTTTILVLDEIDQLIRKTGDEALYSLLRINEELENAQISLVGISNDLSIVDNLDPRVKSSLSEEEYVFPPYNAIQLQQILKERANKAFKKDCLEQGVIEKCAALAAREHGDARRAIELLRVSAEIAERTDDKKVTLQHLERAEQKIDRDRYLDTVINQPKQHQVTLHSIFTLQNKKTIFTGEVYEIYKKYCKQLHLRPLTQRRISDILGEFDMLGIISARVISKGRYGRTREITISVPQDIMQRMEKTVKEQLAIE